MEPMTMALMTAGLGLASSTIGRILEPPSQDAPGVDKNLFTTNQTDAMYNLAMDEFRSSQTIMGEMRDKMQEIFNEYKSDIDMIARDRGSLLNQPSVVDAQMNAALDKGLAQQTALSGTIGGVDAGKQQQAIMNRASAQTQNVAQQAGIARLQEDLGRRQMEMDRDRMLLAGRSNLAQMGQSNYFTQQGVSGAMFDRAGNAASTSANIKSNYQNFLNQQFQLQQQERQRLSNANNAAIQAASQSLATAGQIYGAKKDEAKPKTKKIGGA